MLCSILIGSSLLFLGWPTLGFAQVNSMLKGPGFKKPSPSSYRRYELETSSVKFVWKGLINAYSGLISPADGPRSPSYPTGSAYGRQAIETHGFFVGIVLTADRLLHEADKPLGPIIKVYGTRRYYDPLENNTFWWSEP